MKEFNPVLIAKYDDRAKVIREELYFLQELSKEIDDRLQAQTQLFISLFKRFIANGGKEFWEFTSVLRDLGIDSDPYLIEFGIMKEE